MAEVTDAGEADSTTKVASVGGVWSVEVAALLSAYPFVFCCVHQLLFPCLEALTQGTSPPRAVSYNILPGCCIDVERLHVSHADVLPALHRGVFWDAAIVHAVDMTEPAQSALPEQNLHTGKASTRQDLRVGHSVFSGYAQDTANTYQVEGVESSLLPG